MDPQGKAIGHALNDLGFDQVGKVRQGKVIQLELKEETSKETIQQMCEKLLANPVIEDYEISVES